MGLAERFAREDAAAEAQATFDLFWSLYPRRVAKRAALAEWQKEMKRGTSPSDIIQGLRRQLPALTSKDPQFIPHARTWLHQGRWEDEPEPIQRERPRGVFGAAYDLLENGYGHSRESAPAPFELTAPIQRH